MRRSSRKEGDPVHDAMLIARSTLCQLPMTVAIARARVSFERPFSLEWQPTNLPFRLIASTASAPGSPSGLRPLR